MQKFTKKAIEVQAVQYDGMPESLEELTNLGLQYRLGEDSSITIVTAHGEVTGEIGDYILMSITGDFEICNQDKFEKLYAADETEKRIPENTDIPVTAPVLPVSESTSIETAEIDNKEADYRKADNRSELWQRWYKERSQKYFTIITSTILLLFMTLLFPYFYDHIVKKTIKTTVEFICKEEIEKESNLLLDKTKLEAQAIIDQAKEEAKKEADESFRKEMERLTNERVRK